MEQCWLDDVVVSEEIASIIKANEVRRAALVCAPAVANDVSKCLFDHDWRLGQGARVEEGVAFQLNHAGVLALDAPIHPLASLFADGSVKVVRGEQLVVKPKKRQKVAKRKEGAQFSFIELFAGIGGFRVACEALHGECVLAVELNLEARQTYEANFGPSHIETDVRCVDCSDIPPFDVLTAGFPCQSFSAAGDVRGFDDPRGQLFFEVVRILKGTQPRFFVLENVPHLAEIDNGRTLQVAVAALQSAGYRVATRVLAGASLLAQARSRLFLVGARRDEHTAFAWPELPNLNLLFQDIRDSNDNDGPRLSEQQRAAMIKIKEIKPEKKLRTLMASYKRSHRLHSQFVPLQDGSGHRFLSPREMAKAQGFPSTFVLNACNNANSIYAQLGNAVPPPLVAAVVAALLGMDPDVARRLALEAIKVI